MRRTETRALITLFAIMFAASSVAIAAPGNVPTTDLPEGFRYVTSVEGIHEYLLDNGLLVLLFPDPSMQTATVNITYFVGSLHEGYGETGMAHLLEHLMFKGTPNHPNIPDELTSHGCRPNGSTWFDRTNYFETFAATDENLTWALDLEADRMVNSFISADDLESEMTVVRNEFESGENNPRAILEERVYSTAYLWHNYGNTTIGARADIENVPIDRLRAFYKTWYRPDNAMLVVAGKIEPRNALELVAKKFRGIKPPDFPVPTTYTGEPAQDGERTVTLRRVGDTQAIGVAYHIPAGPHPDFPALAILAHILGDTPSGRLHKELVETEMAASVRASADRFRDPGLFYISAEVREGRSLDSAQQEILRIVEHVGANAPTDEEVERARASLLNRWESRMRNSSRSAIGMSEWAAMGDWRLLFIHRDRLQQVNGEQVREAAEQYFVLNNRTIGRFIPTSESMRAEIPETPELKTMIGDYLGGEGLAVGEEFDSTPENIESNVIRQTLPTGLELVMLPKKTRGGSVNMTIRLHFGTEESLRNKAVPGNLAGSMLMRGTTTRSREEIEDELDRLQANLRLFGSATGLFGSLEVARESLPEALSLLADVLRNPAFPETELQQLKQQRLIRLEEAESDPRSQAFTRLQRHLQPHPPEHVNYTHTPREEIVVVEGTTIDQVRDFHRDYHGASSGEIALVGDFDESATGVLLAELFGGWANRTAFERIVNNYEERPPIFEEIETPDKESAVFSAGLRLEISEDHPDYPPLVLANFMTGGGFLNSRLATRIRQKEGLSYGVRSMFFANTWDQNGRFGAFAIYAPQNDDQLVTAFREEIQKILDEGFTPEEVADAKSGWLQQRTVSRSQGRELSRTLASRSYEQRTMEWDANLEKRIAALTPAEIHSAFRNHIRLDQISIVRAGDFANASGGADAKPRRRPGGGRPSGMAP